MEVPLSSEDYVCSLSGKTAEPSFPEASDGLEDMPAGWTQITIKRRQYNPKWLSIQAAKEQLLQAVRAQVPDDLWEDQEVLARVQVDAQYYGLERDTPVYELDVSEVVYLADSNDILEEVNEIRRMLDLPALESMDEEEEDDTTPETDDAEEVTKPAPEPQPEKTGKRKRNQEST